MTDFICAFCGGTIICGCDHNQYIHCAECNRRAEQHVIDNIFEKKD